MADAAADGASRRARVLVVDDTEGNRYAVSRLLRGAGYEVQEATTGAEALALARDVPDLVVLDINLPDITGYEVQRRIKAEPATATVPVLHLTASYVASADRAFGLEAGADAYLTHPVEPVVLLATVKALLRAGAADRTARALAHAWQATFDAISEPIFLLGAAGEVLRANRAGAELLGLPPDAAAAPDGAASAPLGTLVRARYGERAAADVRALVASAAPGVPARGVELRLDGQIFLASADPVHDADAAASVCVLTDVTARRRGEQERERLLAQAEHARAEAEAANRAKSDFLAVMSHELRTPLNAIGGYAELLAFGIRGPVTDAQRADLERIQRSQRHLLSLINDVLNFAKLESGSVHFARERFSLDEALRTAGDFVELQLRAKGQRYEYRTCEPRPVVESDREKVQQIMLNLLGNAVKFTPDGGTVTVTCEEAGGVARVTVADSGRGVPEEKRESIFEPFVQVDRTRSRSQEGVGLGLAISRDLARRLGGDLVAEAVPAGRGARFVLTLPTA